MWCYGAIQWTSVTGSPWGKQCFLKASVQTLGIWAEKDLRNYLSTPLILQMGKLRSGEVKDLVKITQLVRGKIGTRTQVSWLPIYFTPLLLKRVQRKGRRNWDLCWGLQTLVSVESSVGEKINRDYRLSWLGEVSHITL